MITGKWQAVINSPGGTIEAVFDLTEDGSTLTGSLVDKDGSTPITDGKISGDDFSFKTKLKTPMGAMSFTFSGTVEGDTIVNGKAKMMMATMTYTATRV